jgi:hypothetical protein
MIQLPKTHYESVLEYIRTITPDVFMPEMITSGPDPDYETFYKACYPKSLTNEDTPQYLNMINIYFHLYHMKQSGEKIYYVTPEISSALAGTSLNFDAHFLRSPFREIFVQIDPGLFKFHDVDGCTVPVHGFYVYLRDFEDHKHLRILACSQLKPTPDIPYNDATFYFRIQIGLHGKVQEQVHDFVEDHIRINKSGLARFGSVRNIDYLEDFATFVINTLMYITSKNPDLTEYLPVDAAERLSNIKSIAKRRKFEQRMGRTSSQRIIIIGASHQNKDIEDNKKAGGIGAWKLQNKVRVSGHWRSQWYGSDKDNTKRIETIWIKDYEKGPEFADVINSKFIVIGGKIEQ